MKILFLTNLLPYPLDNGGKIKSYTTLKAFFQAGYNVDLLCFKETNIPMIKEEKELLKNCNSISQVYLPLTTANHKKYMMGIAAVSLFSKLPFSIYKYQSDEMQQKLVSKKNISYDIIYFDHLPMCVYSDLVRNLWPDARIILDEHNCEAIIARRKAKEVGNVFKKLFLKLESYKLGEFEANSIRSVNKTIVLSKNDYNSLRKLTKNDFNYSIIPIGVPDRGLKKKKDDNILNILFIGTLTWEPNNIGLIWFLKEVVPILESENLNYHFYIVGKNPSLEIEKLSEKYKEKITITGYVDSIDEYYDKCDCTIGPLFIGSGQRVKLIEAFSKGMPAISTTIGAEGLEYTDGKSILIADNSEMFADKIVSMKNVEFRDSIGERCRKVYEQFYSQKVISKLIIQSTD